MRCPKAVCPRRSPRRCMPAAAPASGSCSSAAPAGGNRNRSSSSPTPARAAPTDDGAGVRPDPTSLLDLDLDALAAGGPLGIGRPVDHPIYLVCTHGRHDICCADKGRPAVPRHVGRPDPSRSGRAPTSGVTASQATSWCCPAGTTSAARPRRRRGVVTGYEAGRLDLDHYRGGAPARGWCRPPSTSCVPRSRSTGLDDVDVVAYRRTSRHHADVTCGAPTAALTSSKSARGRCRPGHAHLPGRAARTPVAYDLSRSPGSVIGSRRWAGDRHRPDGSHRHSGEPEELPRRHQLGFVEPLVERLVELSQGRTQVAIGTLPARQADQPGGRARAR